MAARHLLWVLLWAFAGASDPPASLYEVEVEDLKSGLPMTLDFYRGKVLLIVNVASQCGYTDSTYSMLNALHDEYHGKGLAILGFPCNQFGNQEPGDARSIFDFAAGKKGVKFDLFRKVDVNGPDAHPLFKYLRGDFIPTDCLDTDSSCDAWAVNGECSNNPGFMGKTCRRACKLCDPPKGSGPPIRWNFESFLVSRSGEVHRRWATGTSLTNTESRREIESLLSAKDEIIHHAAFLGAALAGSGLFLGLGHFFLMVFVHPCCLPKLHNVRVRRLIIQRICQSRVIHVGSHSRAQAATKMSAERRLLLTLTARNEAGQCRSLHITIDCTRGRRKFMSNVTRQVSMSRFYRFKTITGFLRLQAGLRRIFGACSFKITSKRPVDDGYEDMTPPFACSNPISNHRFDTVVE